MQPRELNLRTLHCLFDQSQVALQCSITCILTFFITMFSFSAKHNVLKFSFQILMRRGIRFFSILLWRCGLVLAFRLGDPGIIFCGRSSNTHRARRTAQRIKRNPAKCTIYWRATPCSWRQKHRTPTAVSAVATTRPGPAEP